MLVRDLDAVSSIIKPVGGSWSAGALVVAPPPKLELEKVQSVLAFDPQPDAMPPDSPGTVGEPEPDGDGKESDPMPPG